jgi:multicomponent K+:H+ antiporter subunit D
VSYWLVAPVVLPLLAAAVLLLLERTRPGWQRPLGLAAALAGLAVAGVLVLRAAGGEVAVHLVGNWPAPFGIVLVLDRLAALMVLLTAVLNLAALLWAFGGADREGLHFHALLQFQAMGLNGAFLTGDLFNLFVFFELLLAASYGLLLHGAGEARLRAGLHYVVFNLAASALFLIAASLIYGVAGTLNLADLAQRVGQVGTGDAALLQAGALLLLVVFAAKAALLPLYFWLPATYGAAPAPAAALFAILTKVGVYAVFRVHALVFGAAAGPAGDLGAPWLLGLGLATLLLASLGALAADNLRRLAGYLVIVSAGTLVAAFGLPDRAALAAAVYYLGHSTLAGALLFLLADLVARRRGGLGDALAPGPFMRRHWLLAAAFFAAAIAAAGLPPLAGFVGKLGILAAALEVPGGGWLVAALLASSLLALLAFARAGSAVFWNTTGAGQDGAAAAHPAQWLALAALLGGTLLLTLLAAPAQRYAGDAARQLLDGNGYVRAVLEARPAAAGAP